MNAITPVRPEERRRRGSEGPGWADTVPAWFRSEAFAEDLVAAPVPLPTQPVQRRATVRDRPQLMAASSDR